MRVLVTSISLFLAAHYFAQKGFNAEAKDNIRLFQTVVEKSVHGRQDDVLKGTASLALNPALSQAMADGDIARLRAMLKQQLDIFHASTVFITDARGVILARGHSDKAGDSAADRYAVAQALKARAAPPSSRGKSSNTPSWARTRSCGGAPWWALWPWASSSRARHTWTR